VGLERAPLGLVSTIEKLLGRKSSGSGLEIRKYGRRDPSRWERGTLYPQKLELTSPTSGGRSVGIIRSRTQAMEFSLICIIPEEWYILGYDVQTGENTTKSRRNLPPSSSGSMGRLNKWIWFPALQSLSAVCDIFL
jgi:hypothetical protein